MEKARGVKEEPEYAILTAEISKAAFGLTPSEYKELKGLKRENLRDHMTDLGADLFHARRSGHHRDHSETGCPRL